MRKSSIIFLICSFANTMLWFFPTIAFIVASLVIWLFGFLYFIGSFFEQEASKKEKESVETQSVQSVDAFWEKQFSDAEFRLQETDGRIH